MRYFPTLVALVLALVLAGCSGVKLPPVEPEHVEVFLPGMFPHEDYKVMRRIEERVELQTEDQALIDQARVAAAKVGADALIVQSIRRSSEGGVEVADPDDPTAGDVLGTKQYKILEGLAIYFPSKHPELEEK